MTHAIYGIASNQQKASAVVNRLKEAGFSDSNISVLSSDKEVTREFSEENSTKAPEGALAGGTIGAGAGALVGLMAGIGALAIPGVGPFIAAGPIMAALSGATIGAATGGLVGGLVGLGISEEEAKIYESKIGTGGLLIAAYPGTPEQSARALSILNENGIEDISSTNHA